MKKFTSYAVSLCFIAFLFVGMAVTLLREKEVYSYFENRNLAQMPEYSEEGVLSGEYFSDIDTYLKEHAAGRTTVLRAMTYLDLNVIKRPMINDVVIGDGVLLPYKKYETVNSASIEANAETVASNLASHTALTESYGGAFYYVAIPCQYVCYEDSYPWYMNDRSEFTEASTEALFGKLSERGVDYIDMRAWYEAEDCPEHFSSTVDNHYGILGAYEVYRELMARIIADTDFEPDVLDEGEFTVTDLPNPYLGSRPRKIFGMWECEEKMSIITPNEEIPFKRWNNGAEVAPTVYTLPQSEWDSVLYTMYMGGDIANTALATSRPELPSILIYGDSFTNALESIAWYSFDTMYSLDYRYYDGMSIEEFISQYKPDIVVCVRDYESILVPSANGQ